MYVSMSVCMYVGRYVCIWENRVNIELNDVFSLCHIGCQWVTWSDYGESNGESPTESTTKRRKIFAKYMIFQPQVILACWMIHDL